MAHNLNPNITFNPGTRIVLAGRPLLNEAEDQMTVTLELRTAPGSGNLRITGRTLVVRNGPARSDRLVGQTPPAGGDFTDRIHVQVGALELAANAVATLMAAFDGGANANAKRDALEDALVSIGVIDPTTLPGT